MKYDFSCKNCGNKEELSYRMSKVPKTVKCSYCQYPMKQVISTQPFILKGSGWDKYGHLPDH